MKCPKCGYTKNEPGQATCGLCGQMLSTGGFEHAPPPPSDVRFGMDRGVSRGAAKKIEQVLEGPKPNQIVYVGDFTIVYVFVLHGGGLIILTPGEVFTFGRGDVCDHKIDSKIVSRRHARIHWSGVDPPVPEVVDLDSKNGITVNGVPVKRRLLEDEDEVQIGPFSAILKLLSANEDLQSQIVADRLSGTAASPQRLTGDIKLVSIPGLLLHMERNKESGTLTVQSDKAGEGYVVMISGVIIAAAYGTNPEMTGEEAVRRVAKIKEGRFCVSPRADVTPQSINKTLAEILGPAPTQRRRPLPPPPKRRGPRRPPPPPRGGRRRP
jgi:hypothetical protein